MSLGDGLGDEPRDAPESQLPTQAAALRALAHPIRLQIMSLLTGAPLTAADVARELGITHANASYHLRNLLAGGLILPAGEEKIRGGVAKRYRYVPGAERVDMHRPWTDDERRANYTAIAHELLRRLRTSGFGEGKSQLTDGDLWLEPESWREISERVMAAMHDLHEAAKPPRTPGTIRTSTTLAMFEMKTPDSE
jgi:DNA-binding transcriptional ArsR family regulator